MRDTTKLAAGGLAAIATLHAVWATGSSWPLADHAQLADLVAGRTGGAAAAPTPSACLAVSGLLATAAALVGGRPRRAPRLRRAGARAVVAVLCVRGGLGLAGRTDLAVPGSSSPRFRELDRRAYAPLCLVLAALALPAVQSGRSRRASPPCA